MSFTFSVLLDSEIYVSDTLKVIFSLKENKPLLRHKHQFPIASSAIIAACSEIWDSRWRSWLRSCATSRKVAGSIPDGVIRVYHWHNPSGHWVESASNRNEYHAYFLEGKGSRYVGLTSLPPSCSDCLEIWEPQPSENLRVCTGFALTFALEIMSNWTNTVWAKCRACKVQHVYVWLLPLPFREINSRTLHKVLWLSSCL